MKTAPAPFFSTSSFGVISNINPLKCLRVFVSKISSWFKAQQIYGVTNIKSTNCYRIIYPSFSTLVWRSTIHGSGSSLFQNSIALFERFLSGHDAALINSSCYHYIYIISCGVSAEYFGRNIFCSVAFWTRNARRNAGIWSYLASNLLSLKHSGRRQSSG